jgi:hypothetical protein
VAYKEHDTPPTGLGRAGAVDRLGPGRSPMLDHWCTVAMPEPSCKHTPWESIGLCEKSRIVYKQKDNPIRKSVEALFGNN